MGLCFVKESLHVLRDCGALRSSRKHLLLYVAQLPAAATLLVRAKKCRDLPKQKVWRRKVTGRPVVEQLSRIWEWTRLDLLQGPAGHGDYASPNLWDV